MKLRFEAPRRQRVKGERTTFINRATRQPENRKTFIAVTTGFKTKGYWWVHHAKRWVHLDDMEQYRQQAGYTGYSNSTLFDIRVDTVRAFRRRLKQWSEYLPEGVEFILVSCFKGGNVFGKTKKRRRSCS